MKVDLSRIHPAVLGVGVAVWLLALGLLWLFRKQPSPAQREADFLAWKRLQGEPLASFAEFLASERAPGIYLSNTELSLVITSLALLLLVSVLRGWEVFA